MRPSCCLAMVARAVGKAPDMLTRSLATGPLDGLASGLKQVAGRVQDTVEQAMGDHWTSASIPDLSSRQPFVVTGSTSGLGWQAALLLEWSMLRACKISVLTFQHSSATLQLLMDFRALLQELARKNAEVVLAARDAEKGARAVAEIQQQAPGARVSFEQCDLASFESVANLAQRLQQRYSKLGVLVNNCGVFMPPQLGSSTQDDRGFERTLMTNVFGPVYLTHLLLEQLRAAAPDARVVWMASQLEMVGQVRWDDLKGSHAGSSDTTAYGTSKLYLLMIHSEMQRRLAGSGIASIAAQPGMVSSPVFAKADHSKPQAFAFDAAQAVLGQTVERGARSLLYAATVEPPPHGAYIGPAWLGPLPTNLGNHGQRGPVRGLATDPDACARLYDAVLDIIQQETGGAL